MGALVAVDELVEVPEGAGVTVARAAPAADFLDFLVLLAGGA